MGVSELCYHNSLTPSYLSDKLFQIETHLFFMLIITPSPIKLERIQCVKE